MKRLGKKKELLSLYRSGKITEDQLMKGMEKLGYTTDIEKVLAFKKFISEQIQAFESMEVGNGNQGGYHFDPNESRADLPRDRYGNVITDFSVHPRPAGDPARSYPVHTREAAVRPSTRRSPGGPVPESKLFEDAPPRRGFIGNEEVPGRTLSGTDHQDHSSDPDLGTEMGSDEDEFEIDLDSMEGWDDDEWELDLNDEDEWEDWEEEEWETWEDPPAGLAGGIVEFDEDEEEVFFPGDRHHEGWGEDDDRERPRSERRRRGY